MSNDKADGLNRASSIETNPYKHSTSGAPGKIVKSPSSQSSVPPVGSASCQVTSYGAHA